MLRKLLLFLLVIYAGVATYFAWQFFNVPELKHCFEEPKAKLLGQDLPATLDSLKVEDGAQIIGGVQEKFGETAEQAQQLALISQQLATELNLGQSSTESARVESGAGVESGEGGNGGNLRNTVTDLGQYLYCRQMVGNFETNHPGIVEILP